MNLEESIKEEKEHIKKNPYVRTDKKTYCLTHNEPLSELWPELWLCEGCVLEYYGESHD